MNAENPVEQPVEGHIHDTVNGTTKCYHCEVDAKKKEALQAIDELASAADSPYKRALAKAKEAKQKETRPIEMYPSPLLKAKSLPLTPEAVVAAGFTSISHLIEVMFNTMYAARGAGLAACQIGVPLNIFVIDLGQENAGDDHKPMVFINPNIVSAPEKQTFTEGCLSVPGHTGDIVRAARVQVHYQDETGALKSIEATGILADACQHEADHLNGITYPDLLSFMKRDLILRSMAKLRKKMQRGQEAIQRMKPNSNTRIRRE